jgi:phosphatidate cytidylyltransferase
MFKFRIIGFVLLMALLGGIFFWEGGGFWLFLAAAPALVALAAGECAAMLNKSGRPAFVLPVILLTWILTVSLLMSVSISRYIIPFLGLLIPLLVICGWAGLLSMKPKFMEGLFNSTGIVVLMTISLTALLMSYLLEPSGYWLLFLCLVTKATDTGGYIVGTLTAKLPGGNHKIAPAISPKKSWEGLAGGILLSVAAAWAFYRFGAVTLPLSWVLITALVLSLGSFFGDLTESAVKRLCDVKDSGSFVPGMGGAFDVLDSFLYNGLLFWGMYLMLYWDIWK